MFSEIEDFVMAVTAAKRIVRKSLHIDAAWSARPNRRKSMNTNSELRNLTDEELDAVAGARIVRDDGQVYYRSDTWDRWMWDYFNVLCTSPGGCQPLG